MSTRFQGSFHLRHLVLPKSMELTNIIYSDFMSIHSKIRRILVLLNMDRDPIFYNIHKLTNTVSMSPWTALNKAG